MLLLRLMPPTSMSRQARSQTVARLHCQPSHYLTHSPRLPSWPLTLSCSPHAPSLCCSLSASLAHCRAVQPLRSLLAGSVRSRCWFTFLHSTSPFPRLWPARDALRHSLARRTRRSTHSAAPLRRARPPLHIWCSSASACRSPSSGPLSRLLASARTRWSRPSAALCRARQSAGRVALRCRGPSLPPLVRGGKHASRESSRVLECTSADSLTPQLQPSSHSASLGCCSSPRMLVRQPLLLLRPKRALVAKALEQVSSKAATITSLIIPPSLL